MTYALLSGSGAPATGWPQFSADSVFSTAAAGDLYGTGSDTFVSGGASSSGFAYGKSYANGGRVRIWNDHGGLVCSATTNEEVDSSPAVGPILPGGAYGIATGTGSFFPGVSDENTVKVFDTRCNQVWSATLDGLTGGSPALADIQGNGQLAVVEGTDSGGSGSVWALNSASGATIWKTPVLGAVIGSVTTADLTGAGYQDVIVPTVLGIEILDGRTGAEVASFDDGTGHAGVPPGASSASRTRRSSRRTPTGRSGSRWPGTSPSGAATCKGQCSTSRWAAPARSTPSRRAGGRSSTTTPRAGSWAAQPARTCQRPPGALSGYLTVASDGGIFAFGQDFCGSTGSLTLNQPVVGMAAVPGQGGYWLVASDGGIFDYGGAGFYGSTGSLRLNAPVVGMAATPDGKGYWLVASDGGIFTYGDAGFYGSAASIPGQNIVGMAASPDGLGYWEVSTTGRIFPYGDAVFAGDTRSLHLNGSIVGITPDPVTGGYWLVGSDGGIFAFGAPFFGSTGSIHLNQPVVAMQSTADGAATGSSRRTAASSPTVTRRSAAPWAGSTSTGPWWAWTASDLARPVPGSRRARTAGLRWRPMFRRRDTGDQSGHGRGHGAAGRRPGAPGAAAAVLPAPGLPRPARPGVPGVPVEAP